MRMNDNDLQRPPKRWTARVLLRRLRNFEFPTSNRRNVSETGSYRTVIAVHSRMKCEGINPTRLGDDPDWWKRLAFDDRPKNRNRATPVQSQRPEVRSAGHVDRSNSTKLHEDGFAVTSRVGHSHGTKVERPRFL